jgi:tripartite-type tricarboxylate transporter receptor subunit TctC
LSDTALLRGEVMMFLNQELALRPHVEAATLKLFGVASAERMPPRPDLPTIAEQGFPNYALQSWFAMVALHGTPAPVLARVDAELNAIIASPECREAMGARGVDVMAGPPEVLTARIAADIIRYGHVIRDAGIKPE